MGDRVEEGIGINTGVPHLSYDPIYGLHTPGKLPHKDLHTTKPLTQPGNAHKASKHTEIWSKKLAPERVYQGRNHPHVSR